MRPFVYVGASVDHGAVQRALPDAVIRPPIRRGDLDRAWDDGARRFVVIDGVFGQDLAVSPREIVASLQRGASIVGAASMGALRAAECWPAGMRGVGVIYRAYRIGLLDREDEVAMTMDESYAALSEPLVNVRWAVAKLRRAGELDAPTARRLVDAALALPYPARTWSLVLRHAGLASDVWRPRLARFDRKREDALAALAFAAREGAGAAEAGHDARARANAEREEPLPSTPVLAPTLPLARGASTREAPFDPWLGAPEARGRFVRFLYGSGQVRRFLSGEATTTAWERGLDREAVRDREMLRPRPDAAVLRDLGGGEHDALVVHFRALEKAAATAARCGLRPSEADRNAAARTVATHHAKASIDALFASPVGRTWRTAIDEALESLAIGNCIARHLARAGRFEHA